MDEKDLDRESLFKPSDAVVGYLSARILGRDLLRIIGQDSTKHEYNIDKSKFIGL